MEYEWSESGVPLNEMNWTSSGRRIWYSTCRVDDPTKATVQWLAPMAILVPPTDTTNAPALIIEDYLGGMEPGTGDRTTLTIQNSNENPGTSNGSVIRFLGLATSANAPQGNNWYLGTDLWTNGGNNFFLLDSTQQATRLFIDSSGNVGLGGNTAPAAKLDVNGAVNVAGTVNATAYTLNGAPLQTVKQSLVYGGGQVHAMGNASGAGAVWRAASSLQNAYSPFGGGDIPGLAGRDQGPFVLQAKTDYSRGCIVLPPTWEGGIQVKVRTWYCLKPDEMAGTAPENTVVLMQSVLGRATAPTTVTDPRSTWDLGGGASGEEAKSFTGGIAGEILIDERIYTVPANADVYSRQVTFGRQGPRAGDTETKDIYFLGITVEQL